MEKESVIIGDEDVQVRGRAAKILIVDDEPINLKVFGTILKGKGYDFETASNGTEALDAVKEYRPDLILLDIVMPDMNGYEVCQALKKSEDTSHIPVVMITSLIDRESRHRGLDSGAIDFLCKPVDPQELSLRIRNLLKVGELHLFLQTYNRALEAAVKKKTVEVEEAFKKQEHAPRPDARTMFTNTFAEMPWHLKEMSVESALPAVGGPSPAPLSGPTL